MSLILAIEALAVQIIFANKALHAFEKGRLIKAAIYAAATLPCLGAYLNAGINGLLVYNKGHTGH